MVEKDKSDGGENSPQLFQIVGTSEDLDEAQKMHYLKSIKGASMFTILNNGDLQKIHWDAERNQFMQTIVKKNDYLATMLNCSCNGSNCKVYFYFLLVILTKKSSTPLESQTKVRFKKKRFF
jgi:hypothetical protein